MLDSRGELLVLRNWLSHRIISQHRRSVLGRKGDCRQQERVLFGLCVWVCPVPDRAVNSVHSMEPLKLQCECFFLENLGREGSKGDSIGAGEKRQTPSLRMESLL